MERGKLKSRVGRILLEQTDKMLECDTDENSDTWVLLEYIDHLSEDLIRIESQVDRLRYSMDSGVEQYNIQKLLDMFHEDSGRLKDE